MAKLLYIKAAAIERLSFSVAVADAFMEAYRASHPADEVRAFNVFQAPLPAFDSFAVEAKYAILHGKPHTREQADAWKDVEALIADFKAADKFVLAVPMWNFGIPYRLKHYLDLLIQPGLTFSYDPAKGYTGLVTGRPAFIAYARGGEYPEGTPYAACDFQKKYLDLALGFIGFTDIRSLVVEPTLMGGPEVSAKRREAAIARAREMARTF